MSRNMCDELFSILRRKFGLNNILFIIRYIHAYIQTIQLAIGSDGKFDIACVL